MKTKEELEAKLKALEARKERWENLDPEDYAAARAQLELMQWVLSQPNKE